ncbi:MAG: 3-methyl-2-oxobutanoate hydroxymethyltransferase [Anaerolineae bacterium]|jgi:3-methyl-2-oxobutanoate hydroxymethyltransferase|nr:MAG: 3-methyl-2-oxobutanoate hydroxymethyltransferase [Anaerolineae bacterium]
MSAQPIPAPPSVTERKKITLTDLQRKKEHGQAITMLTAYDYSTAKALDEAGIDVILVGDSLGMVVLGYPNTLQVTMEEMLHHCRAVARGAQKAFLVGDMPFLSYQVSVPEAVRNAGRFLQEGGMEAVKLEGGRERVETIRAIVSAGIPVMGHLGLTPQSIHQLGGFRPQGRQAAAARRLFEDALLLQEAGCFSVVLESVPRQLAAYITQHLQIPTIGIGAGAACNGQVLVTHDLLGLFDRFTPRFAKQYAQLYPLMREAFAQYITEVQDGAFPTEDHSLEMSEEEWQSFLQQTQSASPRWWVEAAVR